MSLTAGASDLSLEEEQHTETQPSQEEEEEQPMRVQVAPGWEMFNVPPARHPTAFVLLLCSSKKMFCLLLCLLFSS